ncbi:ABC transporter substrate-binding protein [Dyella silvatica]|uniref:ABC transporter substrate-binding protein n=1 Tax=Dyella silvatica TaxID=2992128 RepID=UPI002251D63F|nr:extracellular solute-binding protein [Dyella silvatica]
MNIYSSTNTDRFAGLIEDYIKLNPSTTIRYQEYDSQKLYADFLAGRMATNSPDLLISSAMDLQTKLVNDGYAQTHVTDQSKALPGWAQWRKQIFGFSYEPIVLVYDTRRLPAAQVPHTHKALLNMLLDPSEPLKGKIGTYDAITSGLGYLLATQDSRMGNMAWKAANC